LYYRLGDVSHAESVLLAAVEACKRTQNNSILITVLCNLAVVQIRQGKAKDAIKQVRQAIELALKVYTKKCNEVSCSLFIQL
jgi:hypothetical protein